MGTAEKNKNVEVVYPVHLNPAVQNTAKEILGKVFLRKKFQTKETSLIEFFYYPKFGSGQMYNKMYETALRNNAKISL